MDGALLVFLMMGILLGLMVGMALGWFVGKREASSKRREPLPRRAAAGAPCDETARTSASRPTLGLLLHHRGDDLEVVLDGVAYPRYAAMSADSRRRLLDYLAKVRDWMQPGASAHGAASAAPAKPDTRPHPKEPIGTPEMPTSSRRTRPGRPAPAPPNIAHQIDEIVQELRSETNITQAVRIVSGISGGVNILVGLERYEYIDDIPDAEVKALVKRAVKIWESRQ